MRSQTTHDENFRSKIAHDDRLKPETGIADALRASIVPTRSAGLPRAVVTDFFSGISESR